jgi:hypothetical protein
VIVDAQFYNLRVSSFNVSNLGIGVLGFQV